MPDQQFIKKFSELIETSLLLDQEDKQYFLQNLAQLPESALRYFYDQLKPKNDLVESYLQRALQDNPALLDQLKARIIKLRKEIINLQEIEEKNPQKLEKLLEQKLNNL